MKRKIKVALYIRVVLLIGPGFCYYLLTNTLLNNNNNDESKDDNPSSNGKKSPFWDSTELISSVFICFMPVQISRHVSHHGVY